MSTYGKFIVFEGVDGVGKSTQAKLLKEALDNLIESDVILTREPGGTKFAEDVRNLLINNKDMTHQAEALLFAAARSDHVYKLIKPNLKKGNWVISDRFVNSSFAYQGLYKEVKDANVWILHCIGSHGLMPHLTITLSDSDLKDRDPFQDRQSLDRFETASEDVIHARAEVFKQMYLKDKTKGIYIKVKDSVEKTHKLILDRVKEYFKIK